MRYSLIKNGIVENVILSDASFIETIRDEWDDIILEGGSIGQLWDGQSFTNPPVEVKVDYLIFWNLFKNNSLYHQFRDFAKQDLSINTTLTELIIEINNAINGNEDKIRVQSLLDQLILDLTEIATTLQLDFALVIEPLLSQLNVALTIGNLNTVYTLNY
jgi:hypothetical protein